MKLLIQPISQRDPKWASKKLGTSTVSTISSYGCLLICHSMVLKYFGHDDMDVLTLNAKYKEAGVFDSGSYINYFAAGNVFPDVQCSGYLNYYDTAADLSKIDEMLDRKMPVIAGLGATPTEPKKLEYDGVIDHFVLIIGKGENGEYLIVDPWTGETYWFSAKYGDPNSYIFGLRLYNGPVKEEENVENEIKDLQDKVANQAEQILGLSTENGVLGGELTKQESENSRLNKSLIEERTKNSSLLGEKKDLERKVEKLESGIDTLKDKNEKLKATVRALEEISCEAMTSWELITKGVVKLLKR